MLSLRDYFGPWGEHPDATPEVEEAAQALLEKVNSLLIEADAHGVDMIDNPHTGSLISGHKYGGFRPQDCPEGAPNSKHKTGHACDIYDANGALDRWLTDKRLEAHGLAREHPQKTLGWVHLQDILPPSGRRTFWP